VSARPCAASSDAERRLAEDLLGLVERTWPDLAGPDPYDALNSPLVQALAGGRRWPRILFLQALRHAPWNLRPLLGVRPHRNPKTVALLARAYLQLGTPAAGARARQCLDWLASSASPGYPGAGWGYSFAWQSRRLWLDRGQPSSVCTAFVAQAFLAAFAAWGEERDLVQAQRAAEFLLRACPRLAGAISYVPHALVLVHNANLLAAATLAQVWRAGGGQADELRAVAEAAVAFSLAEQRPDGAWPYDAQGSGPTTFVDGFHTGFVLEALDDTGRALQVDYAAAVDAGLAFYRQHLIAPDGQPHRTLGRRLPTDIRDCAEALLVLGRFADQPGAADQRAAVLDWTLRHLLDRRGFFHFEYGGRLAALDHVAYPRWQAWMALALLAPRGTRLTYSASAGMVER